MKSRPYILLFALFILVSGYSCASHQQALALYPEIANLEEYLIDFSKKIEGHRLMEGSLPPNLDATEFFTILGPYYRKKEIVEKVRAYPVTVMRDEESYVLVLCDKDSKFIIYKDLGRTIDFVDYPYFREGKTVSCKP